MPRTPACRVPEVVAVVRIPDQTSPDRIVAMFTVDGLDEVRTVVGVAGTRAGVDPLVLGSLVVAVNEIATNAVRYAGGNGVLHVLIDPHGLYVEISDNGPGLRGDPDIRLPSPEAAGGRGLWLAAR